MTAAERTLLLALVRWARAEGLTCGGSSWWSRRSGPREQQWGLDYYIEDDYFELWRGDSTSKRYFASSVTEAVDVLVALGIVPARFSSAYRAGWRNGAAGYLRSRTDAEYAALVPAGLS